MESADVTISQYEPGDEHGINALFASAFGEARSIEAWHEKFCGGGVDPRPLLVVARDGDRIVGHYGSLLGRLRYRDRLLPCVQSVDAMVDERYRGGTRDVLFRMFERAESLWRQHGVDFMFGYPSAAFYPMGKGRLGYADLIPLEHRELWLSYRPIALRLPSPPFAGAVVDRWIRPWLRRRIARHIEPQSDVAYTWTTTLDERVNALWDSVRARYDLAIERDLDYLQRRYVLRPSTPYRMLQAERGSDLVGLIVVTHAPRTPRRYGFIMECLAPEHAIAENLLRRALLDLSERGVDRVLVRLSAGDPARARFSRLGFSARRCGWTSPLIYKRYSDTLDDAVLRDARCWMVSFGDGDSP